jgi:hypothetical protein
VIASILAVVSVVITISSFAQAFGFAPNFWVPHPIATFIAQIQATECVKGLKQLG